MHAALMWNQGIDPLGRQWLANTRQWRTREVYGQIVGKEAAVAPFEKAILADPNSLAGGYDFMAFDPTMPLDRQFQAGMLKELFSMLVAKPDAMQMLNVNPMELLNHIAKLYNIRNLREFNLQPLTPPNVQVVSDEEAAEAAASGAEPVDVGGDQVLRQLAGI